MLIVLQNEWPKVNLAKYHKQLININYAFHTVYTKCTRTNCGHNQNRLNAIVRNVEGLDISSDMSTLNLSAAAHHISSDTTFKESPKKADINVGGLQEGFQAMGFFPESPCINADEHEPFTV